MIYIHNKHKYKKASVSHFEEELHIFSRITKDLFDHTNIDGLIRNGRKQCSQHTSGIRKDLNVFSFYVITNISTTQTQIGREINVIVHCHLGVTFMHRVYLKQVLVMKHYE